jgi:amidase
MELIKKTACEVLDLLNKDEVSPLDLLDQLEKRIGDVDGKVNALPTLCFDRARAHAKELMAKPRDERGELAGIPVAIKDLTDVEGVLSTHGSPVYKDHTPTASDHMAERVENSGGVIYAKSNTPEFGAGANTFNEVFGATVNPYDTRMSAAGSSGGSAVALATGMAWLAHGSDMGGSLRNPASFCGIVGLRPSPGRVPCGPSDNPYDNLGMEGPMTRNIDDMALLLDAMSHWDYREPQSLEKPAVSFRDQVKNRKKPLRVAYSADLGITPVDPEVAEICKKAAEKFQEMGVEVVEANPDFTEAHESFQTLRAISFCTGIGGLLETDRDKLKPEVIWNLEKGFRMEAGDVIKAFKQRGKLVDRANAFMQDYDLLLTPATIVSPYPVEQRYVTSCNGQEFETYIDWLAIAYAITLVSLPALSLPCGFTSTGLPVGLQMVGKPRGEGGLLAGAKFLEEALGMPLDPIDPIVK